MAKKSTKAVATKPKNDVALAQPDYLTEYEGSTGTESMMQYIRPPKLHIIQKSSADVFFDEHGFEKGDVILLPQCIKVASEGEVFALTPIFFYPEWVTHNPRDLRDQLPSVRERTFDENSDICRKSRNMDTWHETCPENPDYTIQHCEHFIFLCKIHIEDHPILTDTIVAIDFARTAHRDGSAWMSLIRMRKAPMWSCVFEAKTSTGEQRKNAKGQWYGLDITNPEHVEPWLPNDIFEAFTLLHQEYSEAHAAKLIEVSHDSSLDNGEVVEGQVNDGDSSDGEF